MSVDDVSTVHRPRLEPADASAGLELVVVAGPDQGRRFRLDPDAPAPMLLGQSQLADIRLTDPHVSRRHASIDPGGRRPRIQDLGSTNGTTVDGVAILEALLAPGSVIQVGSTALRAERVAGKPPAHFSSSGSFGRLVGLSPAMLRLYPVCQRLAATAIATLIEGEGGTGKELLAEAIHETGPRASGPFVVVDCTATDASRLEDEIFGRPHGALAQASDGTLFIDAVDALPWTLQAKLARALERDVGARVLAATRRDLDREVQEGRFREDLLVLMSVGRVTLPPLRHRLEDLALLTHHFAGALGAAQPSSRFADVLPSWHAYAWPGNVRELKKAVERHLALGAAAASGRETAGAMHAGEDPGLEREIERAVERSLGRDMTLVEARREVVTIFDRIYVERVLAKHQGSVIRAASAAGLARRYFQILKARPKKT